MSYGSAGSCSNSRRISRMPNASNSTVVAKIGTSSITDARGVIAEDAVTKLVAEVAALRSEGHRIVIVTSGAISAGLPRLGLHEPRPTDLPTLQAVAAVGQSRL